MNKLDFKKSMLRLIVSCAIIAIFIFIGYFILDHFGIWDLSEKQIQQEIEKFGALGPLIFILVSFLQVTFIPIPGALTIIAGSYMFGPWLSYLYSFIGMFLGALFAFFLGRKIGRPFVDWIVGDKQTVDYYIKKLKGKEVIILFFMFVLPMFPDDILCSLAGILPISWSVFIFMQIVSRILAIGGTLFFMSGQIIPFDTWWGITIIVVLALISIILFIYAFKNSEKINDKLINFINKVFYRRNK